MGGKRRKEKELLINDEVTQFKGHVLLAFVFSNVEAKWETGIRVKKSMPT